MPQNFLHVKVLIDAWRARNEGRHADAERSFDEAIEDARRNDFANDEALALRMAGEYDLECERPRIARSYLQDSHEAYLRWGATAAAAAIREKYPQFFAQPAATPRMRAQSARFLPSLKAMTCASSLNTRLLSMPSR